MRTHALPFGILAIFLAGFGAALPAHGGFTLTYVSVSGSDSNDCTSPATACRSFTKAIAETNAGGTIRVISAGPYGYANITKALAIIADGIEGGVLAAGAGSPTSGIFVNAGSSDVVILRGLWIDQRGADLHGITFKTGKALHVQNSVIQRTGQSYGINVLAGGSRLFVTDTTINETKIGIWIETTFGIRAVLDRVRLENNSDGLSINGNNGGGTEPYSVTVRDSVAAGNSSVGIKATSVTGPIDVSVERTSAVNNATGLQVQGPKAFMHVSDSTIAGNTSRGMRILSNGHIFSYQNNRVHGNEIDGGPSDTIAFK